jgi:shikimate 5-dehydrogenase
MARFVLDLLLGLTGNPSAIATPDRGFLTALRTIPAGKVFVLFGAGGAARAIAVETTARRGGLYHDREP